MFLPKFSLVNSFFAQFKYRDRITIMCDILKSVSDKPEGKKKTQIMQSAHLNYHQLNKYLKILIMNGFLILTDSETYKITDRGLSFLYNFESQKIRMRL